MGKITMVDNREKEQEGIKVKRVILRTSSCPNEVLEVEGTPKGEEIENTISFTDRCSMKRT